MLINLRYNHRLTLSSITSIVGFFEFILSSFNCSFI